MARADLTAATEGYTMKKAASFIFLALLLTGSAGAQDKAGRNLKLDWEKAEPVVEPVVGPVGRWQIVHGAPTAIYRTFLLDTVTGDTWITCDVDNGQQGWCRLPRSEGPAVSKR
jgi:hypothetical protein